MLIRTTFAFKHVTRFVKSVQNIFKFYIFRRKVLPQRITHVHPIYSSIYDTHKQRTRSSFLSRFSISLARFSRFLSLTTLSVRVSFLE